MRITEPCPRCEGTGHTKSERVAEDCIEVYAKCSGCGAETHRGRGEFTTEVLHRASAVNFGRGEFING